MNFNDLFIRQSAAKPPFKEEGSTTIERVVSEKYTNENRLE